MPAAAVCAQHMKELVSLKSHGRHKSHQHADQRMQPMLYGKQLRYGSVTLQVLICPALDLAQLNTPSYAEFEDDACESKADLMWFWDQYLQASAQNLLGLVHNPARALCGMTLRTA